MGEKKEEHKEKHEEEGAEGEKKGGKKLIFIIAGAIVVVVIILVVVFMMMSGKEEEAAAAGAEGGEKAAKEEGKGEKGDKKAEKGKEKDKKGKKGAEEDLVAGPMVMVENVVINLVSEGGSRYAKVSMAFELDSEQIMAEANAKKPIMNDSVIKVISSKTPDELATEKGKAAVKEEIMNLVNEHLKDGRIKNIYFTNFIIQ